MSSEAAVTLLTVLSGVVVALGTAFGVWYARHRNVREDLKAAAEAETRLRTDIDAAAGQAKLAHDEVVVLRADLNAARAEMTAVNTRASVLESKMDVFWKSVAFDVSNILHSPHAGWEDLDALLEKFREQTITDAEMADLVWQLHAMVEGRWRPADVTRADQVAASLLLRAIEQTRTTA